jgi:RNA polymerase sigma factor (sigma-70 family)
MLNMLTALATTAVILSKPEQSALCDVAQSNRSEALRDEARHLLVQANIRLAHKVAKKHVRTGIDFADLLACASEGILIAINKFDATQGASFTTYARMWMTAKCQEHVQANAGLVHCGSRTSKKLWSGLQKARKAIGVDAQPAEIAAHMGLDEDEVVACLQYMQARGTSLDAPLSDDGATVATVVPCKNMAQDVAHERTQNSTLLRSAFEDFANTLNERNRAIFLGRIANELTESEKRCATTFGCTKQRVGQIEKVLRGRVASYLTSRFGAETVRDMLRASR